MDYSAQMMMRTQLPLARVKRICRMDASCTVISAEAVQLLTLATERFIGLMAKAAYGQAMFAKRKTIQHRDLEFCIKNYELFSFLDGALEDWYEEESVSVSPLDVLEDNITVNVGEEENEDLNLDVDGLGDMRFGFDESLQDNIPTDSAFDRKITEEQSEASTVEKYDSITDLEQNITSGIATSEPEIFGHYGFHCLTKSVAATITKYGANKFGADVTQNVEEMEMDGDVQIMRAFDTSAKYDLSNNSSIEVTMETVVTLSSQ